MAGNHGGKRTPRNPAPVSGPGQLSRRTDGQTTTEMTGMGYGENADFNDIQSSAPLSAAPTAGMKASASGGAGGGKAQATPLHTETGFLNPTHLESWALLKPSMICRATI